MPGWGRRIHLSSGINAPRRQALSASRAGTFRNKGGTAVIQSPFLGRFFFYREEKLMNELNELIKTIEIKIENTHNLRELAELKAQFLGKKSPISALMQKMRELSDEERRALGREVNLVKAKAETLFEEKRIILENAEIQKKLENEAVDVTLPGRKMSLGAKHLLSQVIEEFEDLFVGMGYTVEEGPEVELDKYNFEMLNLPKDHPARDMQDSFYISEDLLLRTHTSPVQVRTMLKNKEQKPFKIICPGKVYRNDDDDPTHSHQFTQIEALVVDHNVTLADLKGTLLIIARRMFGENRQIRLRPSFFPFTKRVSKSIFLAIVAMAWVALYVRGPAGSRFSAQAWSTTTF